MDEAVGKGANRRARGRDEGLLRRRREPPVFSLRCGKRRLPADSIRASSGECIKGMGVREVKAR